MGQQTTSRRFLPAVKGSTCGGHLDSAEYVGLVQWPLLQSVRKEAVYYYRTFISMLLGSKTGLGIQSREPEQRRHKIGHHQENDGDLASDLSTGIVGALL